MSPSSIDDTFSGEIHRAASPSLPTVSAPSAPSVPALPAEPALYNGLDDIFGSSPPPNECLPTNPSDKSAPGLIEPSDLPSVRRQHVTAGYRDGISIAKHEHVQRGFDAGYPVGAQLGMRVGIVLGVLEGLVNSFSTTAAGTAESTLEKKNTEDVKQLLDRARSELAVQQVFGAVVKMDDETEQDTCMRLERVGEDIVAKWEEKVTSLIGDRS